MSEFTWVTQDGRELAPRNMKTQHIINCMKMIERNGFIWDAVVGGCGSLAEDMWADTVEVDYTEAFEEFNEELTRRGIKYNT